jgi:hypothetical protein
MYKPFTLKIREKLRGNGFSLYGLLDDIPELAEDRFFIWGKNISDFDLYIIADIWQDWQTYARLIKLVPPNKIVVIDPADTGRLFPFNNYSTEIKRIIFNLVSSPIHSLSKYFKREMSSEKSVYTGFPRPIPLSMYNWLLPKSIYPISFSIPSEKITYVSSEQKTKLFASSIVDKEVSDKVSDSLFTPIGKPLYKFDNEENYYNDIQESKYGITTKRGGWECLRHYEYAANGAVLCFRELDQKPMFNAPLGLNRTNCIIYSDYRDLMNQIESIDESMYKDLLSSSYKWVEENTTEALGKRFLNIAIN